jgi:nucleoside-diphosphate-sugar epimerase
MRRVLVTGAGGFVGRAVLAALAARGVAARAAHRRLPPAAARDAGDAVEVGEIGPDTDWGAALEGVDTVIHLAARVHQMRDTAPDPAAEYARVNAGGTRRLAEAAAAAGVRRMLLASTVKVLGEGAGERPLRGDQPPAPADPYGASKAMAEAALFQAARPGGMEAAVLRPPLVYGPGVRANFLALLRAVDRGIPLPLALVRNRRSLVFVGNLADALLAAAERPAAAGGVFMVSDGPAVSTPQLVRAIGAALGRRPRLVPVPPALIRAAAALAGRRAAAERLLGSLVVDHAELGTRLGWVPPFTLEQGLADTARWYRSQNEGGK